LWVAVAVAVVMLVVAVVGLEDLYHAAPPMMIPIIAFIHPLQFLEAHT
jgi:hypothetical protein